MRLWENSVMRRLSEGVLVCLLAWSGFASCVAVKGSASAMAGSMTRRFPLHRGRSRADLVIRIPVAPKGLNPALTTDLWTWRITFPWVYQPLVRIDPKTGKIHGVIAARWREQRGKDPMRSRWTISLRQGLTWQDGPAVTAADVAFTLAVAMGKRSGWMRALGLRNRVFHVLRVAVLDHLTLMVEAPRTFLAEMSALPIVPEHLLGRCSGMVSCLRAATRIVGSGPWRVLSAVRGRMVTLVRREAEGGRRDASWFLPSRIEYRVIRDPARALALLRKGALDLVAGSDALRQDRFLQEGRSQGNGHAGYRRLILETHGLGLLRVSSIYGAGTKRALSALLDPSCFAGPFGGKRPSALASWDSAQQRHVRKSPAGLQAGIALLEQAGWQRLAGKFRKKGNRTLVVAALVPDSSIAMRRCWERQRSRFEKAGVDLRVLVVPRGWIQVLALWSGGLPFQSLRRSFSLSSRLAALMMVFFVHEPSAFTSPFRWAAMWGGPRAGRPRVGAGSADADMKIWRNGLSWLSGKAGLFPLSRTWVPLLAGRRVKALPAGGMWFDPGKVRLGRGE